MDEPTLAVWGGLALTSYAAALLCLAGVARQRGDLGLARWKLGSWLLLWYGLTFGLATVTWHQPLTTGVSTEIAVPSVLRALWLVAVGMTAWTVARLRAWPMAPWQCGEGDSTDARAIYRRNPGSRRALDPVCGWGCRIIG